MPGTPQTPNNAILSLALAGVLWGTGGLTGSLLSQTADLSPAAVATYRLAVGGGLIITFLLLAGGPKRVPRGRAAWTRIAAVAALAATFQGSYFAAVSLTSVTLATLITIGASPVLVLVAERVTGRTSTSRRMVGAVALALTGLGLLVGLPTGNFGTAAVLASAGLALLAAAGFATIALLGTAPVHGLDELTTVGFGFALGGLLLLPLAATGLAFRPTAATVGLIVALAVAPTALAYTLFFRGVRVTGAGTAAVMALLEPLTAALLAAVVLGDRLGVAGIVGAALLCVAMVVAATRPTGARRGEIALSETGPFR